MRAAARNHSTLGISVAGHQAPSANALSHKITIALIYPESMQVPWRSLVKSNVIRRIGLASNVLPNLPGIGNLGSLLQPSLLR